MTIRIWFRKMFEISKITAYIEFLCIGITQEDIFPIIEENGIFKNSLDSFLKDSLIFFQFLLSNSPEFYKFIKVNRFRYQLLTNFILRNKMY